MSSASVVCGVNLIVTVALWPIILVLSSLSYWYPVSSYSITVDSVMVTLWLPSMYFLNESPTRSGRRGSRAL